MIITEGIYGAIDFDDSSCHGYCIIKCPSFQYTLQSDFNIDGKVIFSAKMVCEKKKTFQ